MPPLVIGYAYSNVALSLIRHPVLNDLLYSLLLAIRFFPVTLLLLHMAPAPPLSAAAMHTLKLTRLSRWWCFIRHGQGRVLTMAYAMVFVLSFTEFEITSRMGCMHWTIWLFDAQVGGAPLTSTLKWLILPGTVSLLLLMVVFMAMPSTTTRTSLQPTPTRQNLRIRLCVLIAWWLVSLMLCMLIPWWWVLKPAIGAMPAVITKPEIWQEMGYSTMYAALATLLVGMLMLALYRTPRWVRWLMCLPGLCGSLVVGLIILGLFQTQMLNNLYDTPLPLVLALACIALPAALILQPIFRQHSTSHHMAWLTRLSLKNQHQTLARHLRWQQHIRSILLLTGIIAYITYHDLPASALLSPPGMQGAVVRLYNLMHYGKYETLSAMVVLTYMLPPLAMGLLLVLAKGRKLPDHG
jgi:ABC-type Fe3+ transport system permease subunit